jgi:outer membrane protein, multidrug efflux system
MKIRAVISLSVVLFLTACSFGPQYQRPTTVTLDSYRGDVGTPEAISFADIPWWDVFHDEALVDLIHEALQNNYDLRIAASRVEQARALYGVARADFSPQIGYDGGIGHAHTISQLSVPVLLGEETTAFRGIFTLTWELDVWGRIRHSTDAAMADLLASEEFRRGVVLSLVSDVAQAYFELRELDLELEIARRTTESFQKTLDLFSRRLQLGVASKLETARAEAALASTAAVIANLERFIVAKENQIAFLLGRPPGAIQRGATLTDPMFPPDTPPGLPSQLLERRPDIRQAEQTLIAANARVGVAQANFFPRIGLIGLFGGASGDIENVVKSSGNIWSIAGQMIGPLIQGGRLSSLYQSSISEWEQAKLRYEQSVITAFQEVSNALINQQKLAEVRKQQERAVAALQESVRLSTLRYSGGFAGYFEVIESQQQLFPTENALAQTRRDQLIAVVQLYKALGGGWTAYAEQPQLPVTWEEVVRP